jgi:hypothetical protein
VWSADRPSRVTTPNLVGVWQAVRHGVDCQTGEDLPISFPAIVTFHGDGTMTGDTGGTDTTEYGSWQREPGSQNYSFRNVSYSYDENGDFALSFVIAAMVHLIDANSFEYRSTIQIFDADGNLIVTLCGRADGERFQKTAANALHRERRDAPPFSHVALRRRGVIRGVFKISKLPA